MINRGSTPILTNLVGVHPRNIHTKLEANPCSSLREEVEKLKKFTSTPTTKWQRQPDHYSHTHSLSVTKKWIIDHSNQNFKQVEALAIMLNKALYSHFKLCYIKSISIFVTYYMKIHHRVVKTLNDIFITAGPKKSASFYYYTIT